MQAGHGRLPELTIDCVHQASEVARQNIRGGLSGLIKDSVVEHFSGAQPVLPFTPTGERRAAAADYLLQGKFMRSSFGAIVSWLEIYFKYFLFQLLHRVL